jgi:hypothetical protein
MMLAGKNFLIDENTVQSFKDEVRSANENPIKPYVKGDDIKRRIETRYVIDLFGYSKEEVRDSFPGIYQYLVENVKPHRDINNRPKFREQWWIFGEPRRTFRPALKDIGRYIATIETTSHRFFRFLDADVVPDHMVVAIALSDAYFMSFLSSRVHIRWMLSSGGKLGVGNDPRYRAPRKMSRSGRMAIESPV